MAEKTNLQVGVNFNKYPELYEALMELVKEQLSTPPQVIRKIVSEGLEERGHIKKIASKVRPKIKQIAQ